MSGKFLTPIPSAATGAEGTGFEPIAGFRNALPVSKQEIHQKWFPPLVVMPPVPTPPTPDHGRSSHHTPVALEAMPADRTPMDDFGFFHKKTPTTEHTSPFLDQPQATEPEPLKSPETEPSPFKAAPDYNDGDLAKAFAPIMEGAVRKAVYAMEKDSIDALLEPMLRATVRRALAEYSPSSSRPFQPPGLVDRTVWRMQALFSSRTYEDVLFEKTNRFQVEEVYLLDAETLALVSFASCDPARHSAVKRVEGSAQRIALQIRDTEGGIRRSFEKADGLSVLAEKGNHMLLVAIVRGQTNELILADMEFALRRIEDHFRERFEQAGSALMHALQPFLEDCLLIQAPASAA